jgi:hypothetical protein
MLFIGSIGLLPLWLIWTANTGGSQPEPGVI